MRREGGKLADTIARHPPPPITFSNNSLKVTKTKLQICEFLFYLIGRKANWVFWFDSFCSLFVALPNIHSPRDNYVPSTYLLFKQNVLFRDRHIFIDVQVSNA